MKKLLLLALLITSFSGFSQVVGKVTDEAGEPVPYVNIYLKDTYKGTTSNNEGNYKLDYEQTGTNTLVFQFLGFKTLEKEVNIERFPFILNVSLAEESTSLDEVVLKSGKNPAIRVIKKAIKYRKENLAKTDAYTADFYSRGLWKIKNAPKKILGAEVGDLGGGLDSTRSGIVYLSETISKIKFKAPDEFHEKIVASKVSGNDNGFSLNSAREANFNFYNNTIELNTELVSPIADYAFNYYDYKLDGVFNDEQGNLINKVEVTPKRKNDRIFFGYIYIIEDDWEVYGVDLSTTGKAMQITPIDTLVFKQNFKYNKNDELWVKISQTVDFTWGIFGVSGDGRFSAVYSNHDFSPQFDDTSFSREIMSFEDEANKKDSLFWQGIRPIPLTNEELTDYVKKDSVQERKNSRVYKDSIDGVRNKFSLTDPLFGYSYQNSHKDYRFSISGPVTGLHYNTVQGWNVNLDLNFTKRNEEENTYWNLFSDMSYGLSDDRYRMSGGFRSKLNNKSKPLISLSGGIKAMQINDTDPLPLYVNDAANIFFEHNYLKLYDKLFAEATYSEELFNGFRFYSALSVEKRSPLFNTTDHVFINDDNGGYTSNNPFAPQAFGSASFQEHTIAKLKLNARINFGQEYYNYPDGKYNVNNNDFPTLWVGYEKGFASDIKQYNFDLLKISADQTLSLQNKGEFSYTLRAGKFFGAEEISLVDYQHFRGNQTRINLDNALAKFNLLPYYTHSTNDDYAEAHLEHNFNGWILGKIPGINQLNFNMVVGAHSLMTKANKPYTEFTLGISNLGIGKFRFLRVDYVQPYQGGWQNGAFMFGLSF
ncbi:DUF5686 and carboxypeptidase regulatory-like domain-containing protein [Mesonia sp.]|uniref:DUF5686 and carboxypeptidase regulatory-like domain-containing protein n=1 Tax=Mesonia sp. TaxID=1960830 RepID=UPI003F96FBE9